MRRAAIYVVLLAAYAMALGRVPAPGRAARFDPLATRPHAVERLVVAGRFADALQPAVELRRSFPTEPTVAFWLATIHHGLRQYREEASDWEDYLRLSGDAADACPGLPDAYVRAGNADRALAGFERCAAFDPLDPAPLIDLARAYEQAGRFDDAMAQYRRAADVDPRNPIVRERLAHGAMAAK